MASVVTDLRTAAFQVDAAGSAITGAGSTFQISLFDYASSPKSAAAGPATPAVPEAAAADSNAARGGTTDGCGTGAAGMGKEGRRKSKRQLTAVPAFTVTAADRDEVHDWMLANRSALLAVQAVNFAFHTDAAQDTITLDPGPLATPEHIAAFEG